MARIGAPVGTPGNGPLDPAMSIWEYGRGLSESTPCFKTKINNLKSQMYLNTSIE